MSSVMKVQSPCVKKTIKPTLENWGTCRRKRRCTAWPLTWATTAFMCPSRKRTEPLQQRSRSLTLSPRPKRKMMATQTEARPEGSLAEFALYFLKLGCIGFGGPIALVGNMQKDVVENRKWISQQD